MKHHSYLLNLSCSNCGTSFNSKQIQTFCKNCQAPLLANYDIENIKQIVDRDELITRNNGMWRWFELLPLCDPEKIVSLDEGDTPLLHINSIGNSLGIHHLLLKEEGQNPTGSFKARGISAAVSKAGEFGINKIVIPSAGNAGGALAAYAARAGIQSLIYMPKSSPRANIIESQITGATVVLIDGLIDAAGKFAQNAEILDGWFNLSTFREPNRVEGKKILGYEIAESLGWKLPNTIIYPTGGGTGLVGMWKSFLELEQLGWLEDKTLPKMVAVQSDGCAPIVKAFDSNLVESEYWENGHTVATGLCVPHSFANKLILQYIRESNGFAVSVSDKEITESQIELARAEGIFTCPEGAATLAGLKKLLAQKFIQKDETIVLFNTSTGLKYIND